MKSQGQIQRGLGVQSIQAPTPHHPHCLKIFLGNFGCTDKFEIIGLDKRRYQANSFLISWQKHMLWVLIRSAYSLEAPWRGTSNEYPQHISSRNKKYKATFWLKKAPYQELWRYCLYPKYSHLLILYIILFLQKAILLPMNVLKIVG